MQAQRLDKWLWFARIVKSRTLSAKLVSSGRIRVNEERIIKPAVSVVPGDVITAVINRQLKILKVAAPGERRGTAVEARELYEDLTPAPTKPKDLAARPAPVAARTPGSGRPTKRQRRETDALRGRYLYGNDARVGN